MMIPPEILKWADPVTISIVMVATDALRPFVMRIGWVGEDEDRIIVVPLVLGLAVGVLIEFTTPEFSVPMALRRIIINALGAAGAYRAMKILGRRKVE